MYIHAAAVVNLAMHKLQCCISMNLLREFIIDIHIHNPSNLTHSIWL